MYHSETCCVCILTNRRRWNKEKSVSEYAQQKAHTYTCQNIKIVILWQVFECTRPIKRYSKRYRKIWSFLDSRLSLNSNSLELAIMQGLNRGPVCAVLISARTSQHTPERMLQQERQNMNIRIRISEQFHSKSQQKQRVRDEQFLWDFTYLHD